MRIEDAEGGHGGSRHLLGAGRTQRKQYIIQIILQIRRESVPMFCLDVTREASDWLQ